MHTAAHPHGSARSPSTVAFISMREQTDMRSLVTEAFKATEGNLGFPEGTLDLELEPSTNWYAFVGTHGSNRTRFFLTRMRRVLVWRLNSGIKGIENCIVGT